MIGQTISHYKILSKLGEGGMGVVYKAEDTKLHRFVALKFLHPELTRDEEAKARFIHEAQAAAALNHPHICTIHEIDEYKGQSFIAMEFIEGEGLKDRIQKGPLPIDDLLSLTIQIGEGLQKAHEKGIVHRDIKPANIMVTGDGVVKVLDFGLARLGTQTKITKTDTTLGTAAYMSPEQASGKEVDRRSDIWSLGVVLYEMVTGARPFTGEYEPAVVYSILHDNPEPVSSRRSNVPMELERIVGKALTKEASGRYPHVEDMLVDLRALRTATQTHPVAQKPKVTTARNKVVITGAAVGIVAVIALAIAFVPRLFGPTGSHKGYGDAVNRKMIVVLPFENLGPMEDEYFTNGTTDAITARLASIGGLGVISRQSAIQYRKTTKSIKQIGEELGVDYILEGTVQRERPGDPASRVRVIPQLIRVADDTHVWADTYDESMSEVFRVQSDIAEKVATQLNVALLEPERRAIEKRPTENLAAYEHYLRGQELRFRYERVSDATLAVQEYREAVSLDPRFAEAWAGLGMASHERYWAWDQPGALTEEIEAAKRAEELAPDNPETQCALGYVDYAHREFEKALAHFEIAQRLQPSGQATLAIGFTLRRMGKWQEALDQFEDARWLMPQSYSLYLDCLGFTKTAMRRFDEAEKDLNEAISLDSKVSYAYLYKERVLLERDGNVDGAKQVLLEMSNRVDPAEAAQFDATQWIEFPTELRVLPEQHAEFVDDFLRERMERFRSTQPAVIAITHLARALIYDVEGPRQSAVASYDSARVYYERIIRSNPESAYVCAYHVNLGLAYAGLGRREEAIREGREGVRMVPMSKDPITSGQLHRCLSEIYAMCGEHEAAIDEIETLLSVPGYLSVAILRIDPILDPLRSNPRFRRLVEGK
jgi:TolB-like protein/tRNA A-37 threonylcarbamoyl transferase component Bud32